MITSDAGKKFIQGYEQCRLTAYLDQAGLPTIGWGHLLMASSTTKSYTQEQADAMFDTDLARTEAVINQQVKVPLKQCQFDALVSFTFNVGVAGFKKSTLLNHINNGLNVEAEFMRWVYVKVKGKMVVSEGLARRRKQERTMYLGA